ncbi:MAG: hypothetical protein H7Z10_06030, partial [Gemmatimonadaceae bacterium]|nr:hypothetical protein [Acetobacteraceae bacterium]
MRDTLYPSPLLRMALLGDAAASAAVGLLLTLAATPLAGLLLLPEPLLRGAGLMLVPYAALVAWLGLRTRLPRWSVWAVVAVNVLWVADSLLLLGFTAPSRLGIAFVLLQATAVLGFAAAQYAALRRPNAAGL